jgi:hypothetical protein
MAAESSVVLSKPAISMALRPIPAHGWPSGLPNLLRTELRPWSATRFGLIQAAIWLAALNGFLALPLWLAPLLDSSERAEIQAAEGGALTLGLMEGAASDTTLDLT